MTLANLTSPAWTLDIPIPIGQFKKKVRWRVGGAGSPGAFPCWFIFSDRKVLKRLSLSLSFYSLMPSFERHKTVWVFIRRSQKPTNEDRFVRSKVVTFPSKGKALGRCPTIILT